MKELQFKSFIRSRLKTRQLALLVHLDDERCVLRAAAAADMTQPAASKLLRDIESVLEVRLFERHARGLMPTWYGEILVRHARRVMSEINLAQEEIAHVKAGYSGNAAIGAVMNPGTNLVPVSVARVKRQHPSIHISVDVDYSKPLVAKLLQGDLDVVVARVLDTAGAQDLRFEPLEDERYSVIAGAAHPLAGRGDVPLELLLEQPWILPPPGSRLRDKLVSALLERGLSLPKNIVQSSAMPLIMTLLRLSDMIVPLPEESVQPYCQSGLLSVLLKDIGVRIGPFGILTHRSRQLSPSAQIVVAALRETAAQLYAGLNNSRGARAAPGAPS